MYGLFKTGYGVVLKSPKALVGLFGWVSEGLSQFGMQSVDVSEFVGWIKRVGLGSSVQGVRAGAVAVLAGVYSRVPGVQRIIEDGVGDAAVKILREAFGKVQVVESTASSDVGAQVVTEDAPVEHAVEEEIVVQEEEEGDRVDISPLITASLLENLSSGSWKSRKEGLDAINELLASKKYRIAASLGRKYLLT